MKLPATSQLATSRRSFSLLKSFPFEQTRPEIFYQHLATDTALLIDALSRDITHQNLTQQLILDVGGGPGYFAEAFEKLGAQYISVEPDVREMSAAGIDTAISIRSSGTALPFKDEVFDIAYSSNVAEHIPNPWQMGEEMLRVVKPGGIVLLSYTVWLGPFGGHETGLWQHYVGGDFARRRYLRKHGHPPKNSFGTSLFAVSCTQGLRWARSVSKARLLAAFPRYHPRWAWNLVRIPGIREFAVSNLVLVIQKEPRRAGLGS